MESSHFRDKINKNTIQKILEFIKNHIRYFTAGVLFLVLILVLVNCGAPKKGDGGETANQTESTEVQEEMYQIDAYENVNNLIAQYYTAYAAGDLTTLTALATPVSANEQSYIALFSQYVEEYRNIKCYTKSGLDDNSYLVSVAMEIKFAGAETTAPGLDFFYVRTNEDGSLYIDNLYSQYNLANQENALDTSIQNLLRQFENEADVIALQQEVQERYNAAVTADANLSNMISTTIPAAITEWVTAIVEQNAEVPATENGTETAEPETPAEPEEPPVEEAPAEEPPAEPPVTETLMATDRVNVRASADASAEKLGAVEMGEKVTRTGTEGDWSIIAYKGRKGYIKSEYLTSQSAGNETPDAPANTGNLTEGTVILLEDTVNIRSSMSETADKVGTAYQGEKVTVVMCYAEGWTKVKWNGKTGYIKTSLLQ